MALSWSEECNRLVFETVNENSVAKLQLAGVTYSEIQILTSLAQCNEEGESPLVIAVKSKNVALIDELMTFLQNCDLKINKCQLVALIDNLSHHICIVELIDYLIKDFPNTDWLHFIGQVFSKSTSFTRQDKIIAMELIGALLIIILPVTNFAEVSMFGLHCWREAMTLRYFPAHGETLLPKIPAVPTVPSLATSVVFGSEIEVMSMEELDLLQEYIERYLSTSYYRFIMHYDRVRPFQIRIQRKALLVVRSIFQTYHGHPYWLYRKSLLRFGDTFKKSGGSNWQNRDVKIAIHSCLLILEQGLDPKMHSRKSFGVFIETLVLMSDVFFKMTKEMPYDTIGEELCFGNFLAPAKLLATISQYFPNPAMKSSKFKDDIFAKLVYRFLSILEYYSHLITNEEKQTLEEYYSNCIRVFSLERTSTVLHVALSDSWFRILHLEVVELILKLGADPNAIDGGGRTPLHIFAENMNYSMNSPHMAIFQALVNAGSHLDVARDNGETVISMLKEPWQNKHSIDREHLIHHPYFESLINSVCPLSCYCARVIRRHGVRFEDRLPPSLQKFVQRHSAKK